MVDRYRRNINYIRISVTERCNLRCRYCMPEEGIEKKAHEEMLTSEEIITAAQAAVSLGITKIRLTGGEPLVRKGIVPLCRKIAEISGLEQLCVTTNGVLLKEFAEDLKDAGVDRLNISLDTLDADKFRDITRVGRLQDTLDGIEAAFDAGFEKIKINTVFMGGFNDDEIADMVALTKDAPVEVRFIELMPIGGGLDFDRGTYIDSAEVLRNVPQLVSMEKIDGVANMYRLPGAKGRVGLIRPVTCDFCAGCNRIRLTADGMIKPCLHSGAEICIKGQKEEEMKETMRQAIMGKPQMRERLDTDNPSRAGRDMSRIGG